MISLLLLVFCNAFVFGTVIGLLIVRRGDLEARFFRINALIALLLSGLACWMEYQLGLLNEFSRFQYIQMGILLAYSSFVLLLPLVIERLSLVVVLGLIGVTFFKMAGMVRGITNLSVVSILISGALMGVTLVAMNVGHSYLSSVKLSIRPLKVTTLAIGILIGLRLLWLLGVVPVMAMKSPAIAADLARFTQASEVTLISIGLVRILFGLLGPALLVYWTWETVKLQSTQSATGILYALLAMVLVGEAAALYITLNGLVPV